MNCPKCENFIIDEPEKDKSYMCQRCFRWIKNDMVEEDYKYKINRNVALSNPVLNEVKKMLNDCANYSRSQCLVQDKECVFVIESNHRCHYFENCVLPTNPQLMEVYIRVYDNDNQARRDLKEGLKKCAKCGKQFYPNGNKQKYCELCKVVLNKEHKREYMQRKRMDIE